MALFFFLWSLSAWAQGAGEYLLGRILGLDRERGVAQVEVREGVREALLPPTGGALGRACGWSSTVREGALRDRA